MKSFSQNFHRKTILSLLCFVLLGIMSACQTPPSYQKYVFYDIGSLDTVSNVQVFLTPDQDKEYYRTWFQDTLQHYHQLFDAYNSYDGLNNIYTINQNAGKQAVIVEKELYDLIDFCLAQRAYTNDRTNIAFGTVTTIWKDYMNAIPAARKAKIDDTTVPLPNADLLTAAGQHVDMDCIQLDAQAQTVYLTDPQMQLDVGAVAKGYIAELIADQMQEMGIKAAILDLGGNTKVIGSRVLGDGPSYFGCDIEDPTTGDQLGLYIRMDDQACLVTSGSYRRFVDVDGVRYHHLIDPDTLQPAQGFLSVTIVAKDSGLADYLSTALFTVDIETGKEIASHYDEVEVFWITADLQIDHTDGFPDLVDNWAK